MQKGEMEKISADLDAIKKLMILSLLQKGFQQNELASALGVDEAILSKMFPRGVLKKARGRKTNE